MFVQTQNCRGLRVVLHKPSLKKKELIRGDLVEPEVQSIPSGAIHPVLLTCWIARCCATCWCEISNVCSYCMRDHPTLILVPVYLIEK